MNQKYYQPSPYQNNILDIERACPGTSVGNIGGIVVWKNKPDFERIQRAFTCFFRYHTAARLEISGDGLFYVGEIKDQAVDYIDVTDCNEEEARQRAKQWFRQPIFRTGAPLYEVRYMDYGSGCLIGVKLHHLIGDGAVFAYFQRWQEMLPEELEAYLGKCEDTYLMQMDSGNFMPLHRKERARDYFQSLYGGTERENCKSQYGRTERENCKSQYGGTEGENTRDGSGEHSWLLTDTKGVCQAKRMSVSWSREEWLEGTSFCKRHQLTMEHLVFAALYIYISRLKNTKQAAIGRVYVNRWKQQFQTVGLYANTLPVFISANQGASLDFLSLCGAYKTEFLRIQKYAAYSYHEMMVDCRLVRPPFDVSVSYRNFDLLPVGRESFGEELFCGYSETGYRFFANEFQERWELILQYREEQGSDRMAEFLLESIKAIISQGIRGVSMEEMQWIGEKQKALIQGWQQGPVCRELAEDKKWIPCRNQKARLLRAIYHHVENQKDKEAVRFQQEMLTYQEFWDIASVVEQKLTALGMSPGGKVLVHMNRNIYLPSVLVGILRAEGAFVPVMEEEQGAWYREVRQNCDYEIYLDGRKLRYHRIPAAQEVKRKENIAYYMFTSGTTGAAKCVMISEDSLYLRLKWMADTYGCGSRVLQKTNMTFDVSVWELFLPVFTGNCICLLPPGEEKQPDRIAGAIQYEKIETLHFVPSMLELFLRYSEKHQMVYQFVKTVICSGEALVDALAAECRRYFPNAELCNFYGPAECTIDVSHVKLAPGMPVTIGTPVCHTVFFIVNEAGEQMPVGIPGELWICGELVGEGYEGSDMPAYESFQEAAGHPEIRFFIFRGKKVYKTGDVIVLQTEGTYQYIGRMDSQCKLRGMRVHLGTVERALSGIKGVSRVAVLYQNQMLAACYCGSRRLTFQDVRKEVSLPAYEIPQRFIKVDAMPVTRNGKLDRNKLMHWMEQQDRRWQTKQQEGLRPLERWLLESIRRRYPYFQDHQNAALAEQGMDSFGVVTLVSEWQEHGLEAEYQDLYLCRSVKELAKRIEKRKKRQILLWIEKKQKEALLVGIPYGGGDGTVFWKLGMELSGCMDVAALQLQHLQPLSVEQISEKLCRLILKEQHSYQTIYIMAVCVGSAIGVELARRLEQEGKKVVLILGAALPQRGIPGDKYGISYWDLMSDTMVRRILQGMQQQRYPISKERIRQFRQDVRRYLVYMNQNKTRAFHGSCYAVYGSKDTFLKGYQRKKNRWETVLARPAGSISYIRIRGGGHFFIGEQAETTAALIRKIVKSDSKAIVF